MATLTYEEALCYGLVDSIIRKLDDRSYARKMTPRKDDSKWSATNIKRANKLIRRGQMTKSGLKKIAAARQAGVYKPATPQRLAVVMPGELEQALGKNKKAAIYFAQPAPSYRKQYIGWINTARKHETRVKRAAESIRLLERGEKLGLK